MNMRTELRGNILIVRVDEARLDASKAPVLRNELMLQVEAGHSHIVLDLSSTEFMDSSGLGALVSVVKRLGVRGALSIAGAHGAVARLFALTHMDRVFALHPSIDEAVEKISE